MVKNIFNWTIGSFFRSIGRIIAYLVIGIAIAYLLNLNDIDLGKLNLFMSVKADTYTYAWNEGWRTANNSSFANQGDYMIFPPNTQTEYIFYRSDMGNEGLNVQGYQEVQFQFRIKSRAISKDIFLSTLSINAQYWNGSWLDNGTCSISEYISAPITDNGSTYLIDAFFNAVCHVPVTATHFKNLIVTFNYENQENPFNLFYVGKIINKIKLDSKELIDEQNKTNTIISDTNTNSSVDDTNSLFEDSNLTSSEQSLQAIVSAPLQIINNLVTDGSSTPLCFTLNSKQTCIPDGSIIWDNNETSDWFQGGSKSLFITLFNVIVGGFLAYKMFLSLYRIVDDMLNPTNNRIEVMRL